MGCNLSVKYVADTINTKNIKQNTGLIRACKSEDEKLVLDSLIECDNRKIFVDYDLYNNKHETALIISCRKNLSKVALELIKRGANLNIQCNRGNTALIWAIHNRMYNVINELLDKKSDPTLINETGKDALIYILGINRNMTPTIIKLLKVADSYNINKGIKDENLLFKIMNNSVYNYDNLICILINMGAKISKINKDIYFRNSSINNKITIYHLIYYACYKGYINTVKKFIEQYDKNILETFTETNILLTLAICGDGCKDLIFYLLDNSIKLSNSKCEHFVKLFELSKDYNKDYYIIEYITTKCPEELNGINIILNMRTITKMQTDINKMNKIIKKYESRHNHGWEID